MNNYQNNVDNTTVFLKDYNQPNCTISHIDLKFQLNAENTTVSSVIFLSKQQNAKNLFLHGKDVKLISITDEQGVEPHYELINDGILIDIQNYVNEFKLYISNSLNPKENTELMGLYISNKRFFTQCEPEGFRKITYFMDRPDIMATYKVEIHAPKNDFPVLLSNGNLIESKTYHENGIEMNYALWHDPFPKPSYLFALVAGDLVCNEKFVEFTNGIKHLQIWVEPQDLNKTEHALNSLIKSIKWDERNYKRQLDLDRFMMVAVSDFNMGAMENKGLNIFNAKYVLADPQIATDKDYFNIESIVAHEYFHNWTGNRITCRDWFQLSLKEGLTVFRDQSFSSSQNYYEDDEVETSQNDTDSNIEDDLDNPYYFDEENQSNNKNIDDNILSNIKIKYKIDTNRIQNVNFLKQRQFMEDAGSMRHAVQPQSYKEINNFYTTTVYDKGAEVVGMYHTLLGKEGFQKGMQLYFNKHDGQAVTCQDFLQCMSDANNKDLSQFNLWYTQSGTPHIYVTTHYDETKQEYSLTIKQDTPVEPSNKPFLMPIAVGLILENGNSLDICLKNADKNTFITDNNKTAVLELSKDEQTFTFSNVPSLPIPSILRGFSSPVVLHYNYSISDLLHILKHDIDSFNRWQACQSLWIWALEPIIEYFKNQFNSIDIDNRITKLTYQDAISLPLAIKQNLETVMHAIHGLVLPFYKSNLRIDNYDSLEYSDFLALLCTIPSIDSIAEHMRKIGSKINPHAVNAAIQASEILFAFKYAKTWSKIYSFLYENIKQEYDYGAYSLRNLQNMALYYSSVFEATYAKFPMQQYLTSKHMTNTMAALNGLIATNHVKLNDYLDDFYNKYQDNQLCLDKWFSLKTLASNCYRNSFDALNDLLQHEQFILTNPNRVRSVLSVFFARQTMFHTKQGYAIWLDYVLKLDAINPHLAANLAKTLESINSYDDEYKQEMSDVLNQISKSNLSKDTHEIVENIIKNIV
ncbi:MAG: hypothetical protein RLZZ210_71 [Pseudomonadota bacterium]